jgi:hypothetical protein
MPDQNWRADALCAQLIGPDVMDPKPDWWHVGAGTISGENQRAARHCLDCPVRIQCRDDALALAAQDRRPNGTILGGWVWRATTFVPAPGDEDLAALVPEQAAAR